MKSMSYKKIFKYLLVLIWMVVIFNFSKDPAKVSDSKSGFVIDTVTSMGINVNSYFGEFTNLVIRKMGHITEYFVLAVLSFNAYKDDFEVKRSYRLAIFTVFLYALTDEMHQLFVPGRSGQFKDVLIDVLGGSLILVRKIFKSK